MIRAFPFYYTGELNLNSLQDFNQSEYLNQLSNWFATNSKQHLSSGKEYKVKLLFLNIWLDFTYDINFENSTISIRYSLSMFELNIILLIGILLGFFFAYVGQPNLFYLFLILSVSYYLFNLSKVTSEIKKGFLSMYSEDNLIVEPGLWEKQQKWLKDENRCSACGENRNPYATNCTNCGVKLTKGRFKKNDKISATNDFDLINYEINKK